MGTAVIPMPCCGYQASPERFLSGFTETLDRGAYVWLAQLAKTMGQRLRAPEPHSGNLPQNIHDPHQAQTAGFQTTVNPFSTSSKPAPLELGTSSEGLVFH